MEKQKPSLGFRTPSKEIQEAFDQIQSDLSKKTIDWQTLQDTFTSLSAVLKADMDNKRPNANQALTLLIAMAISGIARLGLELTETHGRLSKVEKAVKELQRGK